MLSQPSIELLGFSPACRPEPILLLKLPIMLLGKSKNLPIMLQLCSKLCHYALNMLYSIIFQLNAQLEYLIALMNVLLECFAWVVTALLQYIDLFSHS